MTARLAGIGPHCAKVTATQEGSNWHLRTGEPLCPNCAQSRANYAKVYRALSGFRVTLSVDDLVRFAALFDPAAERGPELRRAVTATILREAA